MVIIKIVKKIWGEEHWIVNKEYCGKKLILNKGFRCSIHHHKIKDETFYVIGGKVLMELGNEKRVMSVGDYVHVAPFIDHRFTGLEDSEIIEFSTKHIDDDSYRKTESGKVDLNEIR